METFKALASPTRLQVLRCLDERRKTLSELSKELELNKATVHEHLVILVATGLVKKRDDEGRKWIYYELSWQGERLLHPQETTTFAVMLGFSVAAAGGGLMLLGRALQWWWADKQLAPANDAELVMPANPDELRDAESDGSEPPPEATPSSEPPSSPPPSDGGAPESSAMAPEPMPSAEAADDTGSSLMDVDSDGIFAILLFVTAALLAFVAFAVRKGRRQP
jgi:DNA-binding transcriptional ArsR family regulator